MSRRKFCIMVASGALLAASGCATVAEDRNFLGFYYEHVDALLFSSNGKDLVVLGQQFHYVFTNVPTIAKLISSSFHKQVVVRFSAFQITAKNRVSGDFYLTAPASLSPEQIDEASRLGYVPGADGTFTLKGSLTGIRYAGKKIKFDGQNAIKRSHYIEVREAVDVEAPSATPLSQSGDGKLHLFQFMLVLLFFWAS